MAKTTGGGAGGGSASKKSGARDEYFKDADVGTVARSLESYAKVDKWNRSSVYQAGFNDDAQGVIDEIASGNFGFASDVAKTVAKYNYKISPKQAYIIASAAVNNKVESLLGNASVYATTGSRLKIIFQPYIKPSRSKPKTYRQLQKAAATAHMPKKDNIVAAMKRRGVNSTAAWKTVNTYYSEIAKSSAGGGTKDVIDLFMGKV